jgi:nitrogen fixation NifU-like protein
MSQNGSFHNELIVDHYLHPRNFGILEFFTHKGHFSNPSCGDEVTVYLDISEGNVKGISFEGRGCSLCIASMSLLSEKIPGKSLRSILFADEFILGLTGTPADSKRKMCVIIGSLAIKDAIQDIKA